MLIQFAFENFRSVRERVVWNVRARDEIKHKENQYVTIPNVGKILRIAGLYGANASGKSTIVLAWLFFSELALKGRSVDEIMERIPFKLDPNWVQKESTFEIVFALKEEVWIYGLQINDEFVLKEWLYKSDEIVFERIHEKKPSIKWGNFTTKRSSFFEFIAEGTRANQPLLAELRTRNADEFNEIFLFMTTRFTTFSPLQSKKFWMKVIHLIEIKNVSFLEELSNFLASLDTGITRVELRCDDSAIQKKFEKKEIKSSDLVRLFHENKKLEFLFFHGSVALLTKELSVGTQRLIDFFLVLNYTKFVAGFAIIDEFDGSFHPRLSSKLIEIFLNSSSQSQLLFTTHNTNLLDSELLEADGRWFVKKNRENASEIYSLAEFQPEKMKELKGELEKGYLFGRFG